MSKDQFTCGVMLLLWIEVKMGLCFFLRAAYAVWFHFALEVVLKQVTRVGTKEKCFIIVRPCGTFYETIFSRCLLWVKRSRLPFLWLWWDVPAFNLLRCQFVSGEAVTENQLQKCLCLWLLDLSRLQRLCLVQHFLISTFACSSSA